jgi:hypothetical protein
VERVVSNLPKIAPVSDPVISISVDTFRRNCVTCDLQQMPAGNKLSFHSLRHLKLISSTAGEKPYRHSGTNALMSMVTRWKSDVYHLLLM